MKVNPLVQMSLLPHGTGLELPSYKTALAAGADLRAAIDQEMPLILEPGQRKLIPTGLVMALPAGFEAQIRPRSGLALKHGITCLNTPGTIDADYRGEIKVLLINLSQENFMVKRGERIAQMVIAPVTQARFEHAKSLDRTERGTGGFGSTGKL